MNWRCPILKTFHSVKEEKITQNKTKCLVNLIYLIYSSGLALWLAHHRGCIWWEGIWSGSQVFYLSWLLKGHSTLRGSLITFSNVMQNLKPTFKVLLVLVPIYHSISISLLPRTLLQPCCTSDITHNFLLLCSHSRHPSSRHVLQSQHNPIPLSFNISNFSCFMKAVLQSLSWLLQSYVLSPFFEIPQDLLTLLLWYICHLELHYCQVISLSQDNNLWH